MLVLLHFAFILFVLLGGLLVYKWHWLAWVHVPAAAWGAIVEYKSWVCPLTPWENHLRRMAGQEGYTEDFVAHYIMPLVYPSGLTRDMQTVIGTIVVVINMVIYGILVYRYLRS